MIDTDFEFVPPPEAPIFEPTLEEFADPLVYIAKIKPIAERAGICKIRPPANWLPPFAIDIENFRFTPRVQRLNELEAKSRIKLNFLDNLAKFWELQGTPLKIPQVERKYLDLYVLHKIVEEEGGFETILRDKKWTRVATRLGYAASKGVGAMLKSHYEKLLYPYDIFRSGVMLGAAGETKNAATKVEVGVKVGNAQFESKKVEVEVKKVDNEVKIKSEIMESAPDENIKSEPPATFGEDDCKIIKVEGDIPGEKKSPSKEGRMGSRMSSGISSSPGGMRRTSRMNASMTDLTKCGNLSSSATLNAELKKLQFYGPGPKAAVVEADVLAKVDEETGETRATRQKTREKKVNYADMYFCEACGRGDDESRLLLCDSCDDAYHTYCLLPPLAEVPKGEWRCHKCIAKECCRPKEAYGFEQAGREYSLQTFGEMADQMKMDYFNIPVHMVPYSVVEKEFWRLVASIEDSVVVEYGADIHVAEMGSGFPTASTKDALPDCEEYVTSSWNLNNLPVNKRSVLQHIGVDISGMKIPWCYVGMCFSCFAWHNEDHWSYSINYLHWGEPKTWYGVPGAKAELLEQCMRKNAPELFEQSPDLLHQLTTFMNPNILMAYGVPVFRTNQCAGEFIVTFPRAYHTGFNQGYNFAEAVNFCPADWIPWGRACVDHYRLLHRQCVFSHEEIVCKMAANPDHLDLPTSTAVYKDLVTMIEHEVKYRKELLDEGTVEAEREAFELLPDDERQCAVCKTTCFLSAVSCACCSSIVCILHANELCKCPHASRVLRFRYTLDELPQMLHRLKMRVDAFDNWMFKVRTAFEAKLDEKLDLPELKELLIEADEKSFPHDAIYEELATAVKDAEKCLSVASQLISSKMMTRTRQAGEGKYVSKLTLEELKAFVEQILELPCHIHGTETVQDLVKKVETFQKDVQSAIAMEEPSVESLEKLTEVGAELDIDVPEINKLKNALQQAIWMKEVKTLLADTSQVTIDLLRRLISSGVILVPEPRCERMMSELQQQLTDSERCEERAKGVLQVRPRATIEELESIVSEAEDVPVHMPCVIAVSEALRKAREWTLKVDTMQGADHYPYIDQVENSIRSGRTIPVRLDALAQLETQVAVAKSWLERAARTFIKKSSHYTLLEVLSPASDISHVVSIRMKRRRQHEQGKASSDSSNVASGGGSEGGLCEQWRHLKDPASIVAAYKAAEDREMEAMVTLRSFNVQKQSDESDSVLYCICQRPHGGLMLQCELCKDWFHNTCVPMPKSSQQSTSSERNGSKADNTDRYDDVKFLCPLCQRSRRPRLETILTLLMSLQKLTVRLSEGEALQCLTERAMAWQDRARQALTEDTVAAILTRTLNRSSGGSSGTRDKASTSVIRPERNSDKAYNYRDEESNSDATPFEGMMMTNEHAYSSSASWATSEGMSVPRKQHQRKTPLVPRKTSLYLTDEQRNNLETLMMEGDLLEVTLEETEQLWRILQVTSDDDNFSIDTTGRGGVSPLYNDNSMLPATVDSMYKQSHAHSLANFSPPMSNVNKIDEKKKKKKRRLEEGGPEMSAKLKKKREKKKLPRLSQDNNGSIVEPAGNSQDSILVGDEDEICSAPSCLQPPDAEVKWVQCDGCEAWFHMLCVGLGDGDIAENEEYICRSCCSQEPISSTDQDNSAHSSNAHVVLQNDSCAEKIPLHNAESIITSISRQIVCEEDEIATDSEDVNSLAAKNNLIRTVNEERSSMHVVHHHLSSTNIGGVIVEEESRDVAIKFPAFEVA